MRNIQQIKVMKRIRVTKEVMLEWLWEKGQYLKWCIIKLDIDFWWSRLRGYNRE